MENWCYSIKVDYECVGIELNIESVFLLFFYYEFILFFCEEKGVLQLVELNNGIREIRR